MLKVSETSWHYNIGFKGSTGRSIESSHNGIILLKSNLCPYMRHICKALILLFLIGWFFSVIPFMIHEFFTVGLTFFNDLILEGTGIFGLWYSIGALVNMAVAVIIIILLTFFGLSVVHEKYQEIYPAKIKVIDHNAPASTGTLIKSWFKAIHGKMCPGLEIVNK